MFCTRNLIFKHVSGNTTKGEFCSPFFFLTPPSEGGFMPFHLPVPLITVLLLIGSNIFMTYAWYGHLRHHSLTFIGAIIISWGIAFFEYCLQVPANRIGYGYFSAAELKTIQEVVSLTVFGLFSTIYLGESLSWNHAVGFGLIVAGAFFVFKG